MANYPRFLSVLFIFAWAWVARAEEVSTAAVTAEAPVFVVSVPVADLRAEPKRVDGAMALKRPYGVDLLEESQLLFGERVKVLEEKGGWARVEAVEQSEFRRHESWEGYPGWARKECLAPVGEPSNAVVATRYAMMAEQPSRRSDGVLLPLGARVRVTFEKGDWARVAKPSGGDGWMSRKDLRGDAERPATDSARREVVLSAAKLFLGEPYYWGGRAGHREDDVEAPSGVDCSGLVNVCYRAAGVDVPRDAHEQYMKSQPLSTPADLKPGDLIFLAWTKEPSKITHVMIFAGGDDVIEAVQEEDTVRQTTVKAKLGTPLKDIAVLAPVGGRLVFFGRLLPEPAE